MTPWLDQINPPEKFSRRKLRQIAHHEAGHAIAALLLGIPFDHVRVGVAWNEEQQGYEGGCVVLSKTVRVNDLSRDELERYAVQAVAGPCAQSRDQHAATSEVSLGASGDMEAVNSLLLGTNISVDDIIDRTDKMIVENWAHVRKLAIALQERGTLTYDEVLDLLTAPESKAA